MREGRAKAWFLSGSLALEAVLGVLALLDAVRGPPMGSLQWVTLWSAVAALAYPLRLATFYLLGRSTTKPRMPGMLAVTAFAFVMCLVSAASATPARAAFAVAISASGIASALGYVFWYSRLGRGHSAQLQAGARLPELPLVDIDGKQVLTSSFRGSRVLYLFFRGNWCPLCMAQVREVASLYRQLDARGVRVALVSPQPNAKTAALAKRFDAPMSFFEDRDLAAARALGIVHAGGVPATVDVFGYDTDTVLPTVVLVDEEGVVLWADQTDNYRVRPEPATFLAVLDRLDAARAAPALPAAPIDGAPAS